MHTGGEHGSVLSGDTLAELARKHQVAQAVIARLRNFMDAEALRSVADGVVLNLDTVADAERSAMALQARLPDAEVAGEFDVRTDKPILRISRRHHGNVKSSVLTQDFVHGADYAALADSGAVSVVSDESVADTPVLSLPVVPVLAGPAWPVVVTSTSPLESPPMLAYFSCSACQSRNSGE